jgi:nitrogen fixation NifU-like protein
MWWNIMDKDLKRSIILDNYQNSQNRKRHDNEDDYIKLNSRNVSCIDNIDLYIKINNDKIEEITFDGEACVISISSTSIMTDLLKDKSIDEALEIIKNFDNMIEEKEYNEDLLNDAVVYDDISKQPSRKKCATLSWNGLYDKLISIKNENNL